MRLVTNAYWATSDAAAARGVDALVRAGLAEINVSTGDQHARFVPLANVFHATRASVAAGLDILIIIETVKERRVTRATVVGDPAFGRIRADFPFAPIRVQEWVWRPLSPFEIERYPDGVAPPRGR